MRPAEAFRENCEGPVIESRPALPHSPGAARSRRRDSDKPGGARKGRAGIVGAGPCDACALLRRQKTGVSGRPLPA